MGGFYRSVTDGKNKTTAWTFFGGLRCAEECAKQIPTAPTQRRPSYLSSRSSQPGNWWSDNLDKLHLLENRPKSGQFLVDLGCVNAHPVLMKARSPEKLMDVSVFTTMILCPATDDQHVEHERDGANLDW